MREPAAPPPSVPPPTPALTVTATAEWTVVVVTGPIDAVGTDRLHTRLTEEVALRPAVLVLDLTGVTFCSARGVSIFAAVSADARAAEIPCAVVAHRAVLRPLVLLQLDHLVPLRDDVDDALRRVTGETGRPPHAVTG